MTKETPETLKKNLWKIISDMQNQSALFVKRPEKDFSRKRKISFSKTINFLLSMNGNTVCKEWLDYWDYSSDIASVSAFSQQPQKILPEAVEFLFLECQRFFRQLF